MHSFGTAGPASPLTDGQKTALMILLADEDPSVYRAIRAKILSCGPEVVGWLKTHALSREPIIRRRVVEMLRVFGQHDADNDFLAFCLNHGDDLDIERGAWLLSRTQYPEINVGAILDAFAQDLRVRLGGSTDVELILGTINDYLFDEQKFRGNEFDYFDPENSYLSRVLDRRMGNPISLCLVYILIGKRLRLPIVGIGMPGHFLARYQCSTTEMFIDAFNRGKLLRKADCIKYLMQSSHGFQEQYLGPASPRRMLSRMCANLHQIFVHRDQADEAARFQRYLIALDKKAPEAMV
jgi:regulator of sirC expression with transglutaminase-like and TPR domain